MSDPKRLSVIRNTSLNYLGQAYALLIGILILPFYLKHLGAELAADAFEGRSVIDEGVGDGHAHDAGARFVG